MRNSKIDLVKNIARQKSQIDSTIAEIQSALLVVGSRDVDARTSDDLAHVEDYLRGAADFIVGRVR